MEYDLAQNDLAKAQSQAKDQTKVFTLQHKMDARKTAYESYNTQICAEMNRVLSNKHTLFDAHVKQVN